MRLDEISRRGFIKGIGAAGATAAAASIAPAKVIAAINSYTEQLGGKEAISLLDQLLSITDARTIWKIGNWFGDEGNIDEFYYGALTTSERKDLEKEILRRFSLQNKYDSVDDFMSELIWGITDGKGDGRSFRDTYDIVDRLIGRKTLVSQIDDILKKYNISEYEFASDVDLWNKVEHTIWSKPAKQNSVNQEITIDNLADIAKSSSLPSNLVRLATTLSSVMKKLLGKENQDTSNTSTNQSPPIEKPLSLPAPSDNELGDLSNIERMKDLAGIQRK